MLSITGCSSDTDKDNIEEKPEWLAGPDGSFKIEIVNKSPVVNADSLFLANIVLPSEEMTSPVEQSLFSQGKNILFELTDIPEKDRKIGCTLEVKIMSYYQIYNSYGNVFVFCRIKKL